MPPSAEYFVIRSLSLFFRSRICLILTVPWALHTIINHRVTLLLFVNHQNSDIDAVTPLYCAVVDLTLNSQRREEP
jgi:hypothetical protein